MRRKRSRGEDDTEINLTPMLDVTFIMLIFFIVTASFVKEAGVDVSRPPAQTAENKDKSWTADNAGNVLCAKVAQAVYQHYAAKGK